MALSADNRLRRPAEFKHVLGTAQKAGGRAGDRLLLVAGVPNSKPGPRIGLSVSKKVGGSVTRNRVKRRLREIFRELVVGEPGRAGWDFVASARPAAADATYEDLRNSAAKLISRVRAVR